MKVNEIYTREIKCSVAMKQLCIPQISQVYRYGAPS